MMTLVQNMTSEGFEAPAEELSMSGSSGSPASSSSSDSLPTEKYSLRPRSIQKRIEVEQRKTQKRQPKPKQKPAPLSKYRRKTANARERTRMKEINQAFETLRFAIPSYPTTICSEKLTKITTLRLAMNYIEALTLALGGNASGSDGASSYSGGGGDTDFNNSARGSLSSVGESSSDLGEYASDLLSDNSSNLGDPLDSFDDINLGDAFDMLLESDGDSLNFHSDLSDQPTP